MVGLRCTGLWERRLWKIFGTTVRWLHPFKVLSHFRGKCGGDGEYCCSEEDVKSKETVGDDDDEVMLNVLRCQLTY